MKKQYIVILVGLITLFASCKFQNQNNLSNTDGATSVRICLGAASRTITSSATSLVDTFTVTLTDSDGTEYTPDAVSSGEEVEIIVSSEGDFTVEVKTFDSEGKQNGLGNESGTIALGDILEIPVSISFWQTTTGNMSLPISFPTDRDITAVTASFLDNEASSISVSVDSVNYAAGTATLTATDVSSGLHYLVVNFSNSKDDSIGSVVEAVNIWDGATASSWLSDGTLSATRVFTTDEIAYSSTVSTLVIAGEIIYLSSDTSEVFEYDSTDATVSFSIVGIPYNSTVTYTWNGGTVTSCEEGVSSADLATNSTDGTNTLVLAFTAEDSSVTTHTITVNRYCEVEFSNNYGDNATKTVKYGTVLESTELTAAGFIFGGWYTDATCTSAYNFETPITDNTIFYAKWTQTAGISVSISSPAYQSLSFTQFDEVVTSTTLDVNAWLPLSISTEASSYQWKLDGTNIFTDGSAETSSSYTYKPTSAGQHTITATFVYDGVSYSGDLVVNVTDQYMVPIIPLDKTATYTQATSTTEGFDHTLTRSYSMGKYEVTYELWYLVRNWAEKNGYTFANQGCEGNDGTAGAEPTDSAKQEPVTKVSWRDVIIWCNAYSEMVGLSPVYYTDASYSDVLKTATDSTSIATTAGSEDNPYVKSDSSGYRLPTEGEWQYVATCGGVYPYDYASGADATYAATSGGTDTDGDGVVRYSGNVAWDNTNSTDSTHEVGTKEANKFGLYDMSGNVWEWCWDWDGTIPTSAQENFSGVTSGSERIFRGGELVRQQL